MRLANERDPSPPSSREPSSGAQCRKLLRWAGSKASVAKYIEPHIDFTRHYIEPFAGSAIIFFRNLPSQASLNDINSSLVDLYAHVRDDPYYIWATYNRLQITSVQYYKTRAEYNRLKSGRRKSALFLFLNHYCFNGIYRTNTSGAFNTPFSGYERNRKKLPKSDLFAISKALHHVTLGNLDFSKFLRTINPRNACIYMDPPYFTNDKRIFREYGPGVFSEPDLHRLLLLCIKLQRLGNKVVVSYAECREFKHLFSNHIIDKIDVSRNVGGFKERRTSQSELIAVFNA